MALDDVNEFEKYRAHISRLRSQSLSGDLILQPDGLWLAITENCNFRCIGCWRDGLFRKTYVSADDVRRMLADSKDHSYTYISLTTGEAFLNAAMCEILEACREYQPNALIDVISNGSIPPKGRFRTALTMIDRLGLSIDGATPETFERIRVGGKFDRFVENAKEICAIQAETGSPKHIGFSFTANATNLAELPDVIRLAAAIGVPWVYAQPMEAADPIVAERLGTDIITNVPFEDVYRITDEAVAVGADVGVKVGLAAYLQRPKPGNSMHSAPQTAFDAADQERAVRLCQYPYQKPFRYVRVEDRFHVLPCCYMDEFVHEKMARDYGMSYAQPPSVTELYNSEAYWNFRTDLAEGRAQALCGNCMAARSYQWKGQN